MSEKQKILITSALPYANGPIHFGHIAGAYLPADCCARYHRQKGRDVLYICGSDEYGIAIALNAELAGRTPLEHVNIFHEVNKTLFQRIEISFDHYSRTTCESHKEPVYSFFNELFENGFIEGHVTDQLYSEKDQRFLADRYVVGTCPKCKFEAARGDECTKCGASYEAIDLINPRSKLTDAHLIKKATKHWFIMLDKFKDRLTDWIEAKNWKPNVVNFAKQYIKELRPRAITRDSDWGLPVPLENTEKKVLYVWFDAPIGYISASMEWATLQGKPDLWKKYWLDPKTRLIQFIGKDNIPFHAVIFPAMIMGQNQPYKLVDELPANEFYNLEGKQFSKSEGWSIDLDDFFSKYSADQIRYTIAANAPETQDSEFAWKDFQSRCNAELLGKYGNLVNRVLVFAEKNCGGKIPPKHTLDEIDHNFLDSIHKLSIEISQSYESFKLRRASQLIMELAQQGNTYFDTKHPWKDVKHSDTIPRMETTIYCSLQCLMYLAIVSYPILPTAASHIWKFLGHQENLDTNEWDKTLETSLIAGKPLGKYQILFRKIEDSEIETELSNLHAMVKSKEIRTEYDPPKAVVSIDDFQKLDLRVGQILKAEKIPDSNKLLKLQIDLGFETRTIVSGISDHYSEEELVGKKVAVIMNLKPCKIRGVLSEGMILAGSLGPSLELLGVSALAPGAVIK